MAESSHITNRNRSNRRGGRSYGPPLVQAEARICPNCQKPTSLGNFRCKQCNTALSPFSTKPQNPEPPELALSPADNLRVLAAYCVDAALILGAITILTLLFTSNQLSGLTRGAHFLDHVLLWFAAHLGAISIALLTVFGATLLYQCTPTALCGYTPGRRFAGIVLIHREGSQLTRARLILRTLLSVISWGSFGAGYFLPILDPYHRTFHDMCSQTVLVKRKLRI